MGSPVGETWPPAYRITGSKGEEHRQMEAFTEAEALDAIDHLVGANFSIVAVVDARGVPVDPMVILDRYLDGEATRLF